MKLTVKQLRNIIKEEVEKSVKEVHTNTNGRNDKGKVDIESVELMLYESGINLRIVDNYLKQMNSFFKDTNEALSRDAALNHLKALKTEINKLHAFTKSQITKSRRGT